MKTYRNQLLTSSKLPAIAGAGAVIVTVTAMTTMAPLPAAKANPAALPVQIAQCGAKKCNPCAAAKCNPCGAAKCNPCAAAKCNPCGAAKCNPCAAAKCNPCNPCGAAKCNPCNPCNPCGAGGAKSACVVPRLAANPCAAAKCNPCNPCGAAKCNPCAAAKCNPCNPCGAAKCNPCSPCSAAKCNPCNPCSAAKCNPCNPCAAAKCNPCNPCSAAKCNPCSPCNPCNPCGAGGAVEITQDEAVAVYDCLLKELKTAYAGSGLVAAKTYLTWPRYNSAPYVSGTHGGRHVNNYASRTAGSYGDFEKGGKMAVGGTLAKDSFGVNADGSVALGPLFLMKKMAPGFNPDSGDWQYTMVMPGGAIFGVTNGKNSAGMTFCYECHLSAEDQDSMLFLPEEYRIK